MNTETLNNVGEGTSWTTKAMTPEQRLLNTPVRDLKKEQVMHAMDIRDREFSQVWEENDRLKREMTEAAAAHGAVLAAVPANEGLVVDDTQDCLGCQ